MKNNKSTLLSKRLALLLMLPILFELAMVGGLVCLLNHSFSVSNQLERSRQISSACSQSAFSSLTMMLMSGAYNAIPTVRFLKLRERAEGSFEEGLKKSLTVMRNKYPPDFLLDYENTANAMLKLVREIRDTKSTQILLGYEPEGHKLRSAVLSKSGYFQQLCLQVAKREEMEAETLSNQAARSNQLIKRLFYLGLTINILCTSAIAFFLSFRLIRRLNLVKQNIEAVNNGAEYKNLPGRKDEISKLNRKLAESIYEARKMKDREAAILSNASEAILELGKDFQVLSANSSVEKLLGYSKIELFSKPFTKHIEHARVDLDEIFSGEALTFEATLRHKSKQLIPTKWSISFPEKENQALCIIRDLTLEKAAEANLLFEEERLKSLLSNINIGVLEASETGAITFANASFQSMSGIPAEHLKTKNIADLLDGLTIEEARSRFLAGAREPVFQHKLNTATGKALNVEMSVHKLSENFRAGYAINMIDISARMELEATKVQFVEAVRSRLSRPLIEISEHLNRLAAGDNTAMSQRSREKIKQALKNTDRLEQLVLQLVDLEKLEVATVSVSPSGNIPSSTLEQAASAVRDFAESTSIKIVTRAKDEPWTYDQGRIVQVLVNLLSNSIKFSNRGSTVVAQAYPQDGKLRFEIVDQGPGISKELQADLFKPFRQANHQTATKVRGTGLGLSICKTIVDRHGGRIGVTSEPGKGSVFWFELPGRAT